MELGRWRRPCPGPARHLSSPVLGSEPYIHVQSYDAGWIQLVCKSAGWFPKPWAQWRDPQGKVFPSLWETHSLDEAGLFRTAVSNRVRDSTLGNVSCTIQNVALGQERTTAMVIAGKRWARDKALGTSKANTCARGNCTRNFQILKTLRTTHASCRKPEKIQNILKKTPDGSESHKLERTTATIWGHFLKPLQKLKYNEFTMFC